VIQIAPEPDFRFPIEALLAAISRDTRIIYLTDPNNPTGLGIPAGAVEAIAAAAPEAIVLVDEAYADFSGRTFIGRALDRMRNVVVGRTFAKGHGLAALRVGALVAHPETLAPLRRLLPPYSLNLCAIRALGAALTDRDFLDRYVAAASASRQLIYAFADRHGLRFWPSEANFVLLRLGDRAASVVDAVAARGIFIRDRSTQPGCAGCVRITAGVVAHTTACLAELEDILATSNR
jgi:histidinol-phosphate aminotransferase